MSKEKVSEFEKELENLINRHSKENESDTPDFILAMFISGCLKAFNKSVKRRDKWYGFKGLSKGGSVCYAEAMKTPVKNKKV